MLGSYKTPAPFKDEDKWFRFFTKRALVYVLVALFIGGIQILFFQKLHLTLIGMTIFVLLLACAIVLGFGKMPPEKYLFGGGERFEALVIRLFIKRRKKNRCLYLKNYGEDV